MTVGNILCKGRVDTYPVDEGKEMKAHENSDAGHISLSAVSYQTTPLLPRVGTAERKHLVKSFYASLGVGSSACNIYYELYSWKESEIQEDVPVYQVVFIAGLACAGSTWRPQLKGLLESQAFQSKRGRLEMCVIDNRGIGQSSSPLSKQLYTTTIMAKDILAVMNDLGWQKAHIVGFSMGGMIATKLAAIEPDRVETLTLLCVTAGGFSSVPRSWRGLKYAIQGAFAKSPDARTNMDLKFHYTKQTLQQQVNGVTRMDILRQEYQNTNNSVKQEECGLHGQLHAVWHHSVTSADVASIASRAFPVIYVHGRHDLLASYRSAERLAQRMRAQLILLEGAHFIMRECGHELNLLLENIIVGHNPEVNRMRFMDPIDDLAHIEIKMNCA